MSENFEKNAKCPVCYDRTWQSIGLYYFGQRAPIFYCSRCMSQSNLSEWQEWNRGNKEDVLFGDNKFWKIFDGLVKRGQVYDERTGGIKIDFDKAKEISQRFAHLRE